MHELNKLFLPDRVRIDVARLSLTYRGSDVTLSWPRPRGFYTAIEVQQCQADYGVDCIVDIDVTSLNGITLTAVKSFSYFTLIVKQDRDAVLVVDFQEHQETSSDTKSKGKGTL